MDNNPHTIAWKDEYSVKVKEIDEQHKKFVEMLNNLYKEAMESASRTKVRNIIDNLIEYAGIHFKTEEKYFDKFHYPLAAEHKEQHRILTERVVQFSKRFNDGEDVAFEILDFLEDWLVGHLAGYDMKYSQFFNEHGLF